MRNILQQIDGEDGQKGLVLIELQGKLELEDGSFAGMEVGELAMNNGAPTLTVGKQRLKGSIVKLKKPLIVMDTYASEDAAGKIVHALEEKIVFTSRPTTLFDR